MMKAGKRFLSFLLVCTLLLTLLCGMTATASGETEVWKTPMEAVSEMTWGVNLSDLYIATNNPVDGDPVGYYDTSALASKTFDFCMWFWNGEFAWKTCEAPESTFSISFPITEYNDNTSWLTDLFSLGIIADGQLTDCTITLSGSKITQNGTTIHDCSFLDQTYDLSRSTQANGERITHWLWQGTQDQGTISAQLPAPSPDLNGAHFETTITLGNANAMTPEEKADFFFQRNRYPMDPEDLTDLFLDQGVDVIRLPVTWTPFINDQTFEIDQAWLEKVQIEVDYILSQGAYCILNMHNDYLGCSFVGVPDGNGGWTDLHWEDEWMYGKYAEYVHARYTAVWTQIATYFKDYPQQLILESFNEPTMNWHGDNPPLWDSSKYQYAFDEQVARVNELNQLFVNTVRTTGGNNGKRLLCIAPANYNTYPQLAYYRLTLPKTNGDVDENLIVQLHSYEAMEVNGDGTYNPNYNYVAETKKLFDAVEEFQSRYPDVPVLIGEVGVAHNGTDEDLAPRVAHYFAEAEKRDIPCLWWEDYFTGNTAVQYWLYDKSAQEWGRPQILQTIKNTLGITETSTTVKVSVNGTKHSFTTPYSEECTVYAAVYDESGKLLGITARSFDGSAVDLSLTIQNLPRTYSVKAFLLDTESYCPLAAVPE